jgi:valyl-tRNA synthetase
MQREVPDKPGLEGLEATWTTAWAEQGTYHFDRTATRDRVYSIDTPPPTVSGSLHVGHVFSYTHTDLIARYKRMRGFEVFYPMGWDDNGLPTERRVQNYFGVRCDPSQPYDPEQALPDKPSSNPAQQLAVSRKRFVELCEQLTEDDEKAFEALWRRLGLSIDWRHTYQTIDDGARATSQRAFLRNLARGEAYQAEAPTLWDVTFRTAVAQAELEDRERPSAYHRVAFYQVSSDGPDDRSAPVWIETTRPELIAACVALVAHPDDERYKPMFGSTVRSPLFEVDVPVLAHPLAEPGKGSGIAMICTFGDVTDVTWWRELALPTRPIIGWDGRLVREMPTWITSESGQKAFAELGGKTAHAAKERIAELLTEAGHTEGEPRPITHPVKFYEKGDKPLEIVTTRQWYITNGGREPALREQLLARGAELAWHPEYMRHRYESWVSGLNGDWLVSRQRFFGVPIPLWYQLDGDGNPLFDDPITPDESHLPVDPQADVPTGYTEDQRGVPGGFIGDPDVMDTWATSSLSPQIAGGWERDPDLFDRVYPMDLRPQAHEIIRTWLFSSVVRAHLEFDGLPWSDAAISGWILDPDRKKMAKSRGNVVTPMGLLEEHGSDALRYWAASGRPGTDTAFDVGQMKIGRRLAIKILNASKFVLSMEPARTGDADAVTNPLDQAMLASLAEVVERATTAFESYDYTRALETTETFFWTFCDDYLEMVKERAYGGRGAADAASAHAALALALSVQLRLFAPFLPFATEEVWSWWQPGSIHRASWPSVDEVRAAAGQGDPEVLTAASVALSALRKAKSERKLSMRAELASVVVRGPETEVHRASAVAADLRAAGRVVGDFDFEPAEGGLLTVDVVVADAG